MAAARVTASLPELEEHLHLCRGGAQLCGELRQRRRLEALERPRNVAQGHARPSMTLGLKTVLPSIHSPATSAASAPIAITTGASAAPLAIW